MRSDDLHTTTTRLVRGTFATLAVTGVVAVSVSALIVGRPGVLGALVGLGLVGLLFGGSAALLALVVRRSPTHAAGMLAVGAFVRLAAYAVVLATLSGVGWIDPQVLAVTTGAAVTVTLAYELHALSRMPRLFWIDDVIGQRPVPSATRS
ncbi:MAG: hypothetical protein WDZ26_03800 [Nitriliruptoraceae bacterium]